MTDSASPKFQAAFPYQKSVLNLPVSDLEVASQWYSRAFGMREVERSSEPSPALLLERDGVQLGFAITGEDPAQDGAAIKVSGIQALREEFEAQGVSIGNWRIDERDGKRFQVFFVVAPDGLCFYFHEPL